MIKEGYIREWNEFVPWKDMLMVEQDLIICRALVSIFSDDFLRENLAFRGGTALHKLFLQPQPRYSEDIDLVQIKPGPIKPIILKNWWAQRCVHSINARKVATFLTFIRL